jgi:hypothetical protein
MAVSIPLQNSTLVRSCVFRLLRLLYSLFAAHIPLLAGSILFECSLHQRFPNVRYVPRFHFLSSNEATIIAMMMAFLIQRTGGRSKVMRAVGQSRAFGPAKAAEHVVVGIVPTAEPLGAWQSAPDCGSSRVCLPRAGIRHGAYMSRWPSVPSSAEHRAVVGD